MQHTGHTEQYDHSIGQFVTILSINKTTGDADVKAALFAIRSPGSLFLFNSPQSREEKQ